MKPRSILACVKTLSAMLVARQEHHDIQNLFRTHEWDIVKRVWNYSPLNNLSYLWNQNWFKMRKIVFFEIKVDLKSTLILRLNSWVALKIKVDFKMRQKPHFLTINCKTGRRHHAMSCLWHSIDILERFLVDKDAAYFRFSGLATVWGSCDNYK